MRTVLCNNFLYSDMKRMRVKSEKSHYDIILRDGGEKLRKILEFRREGVLQLKIIKTKVFQCLKFVFKFLAFNLIF